MKRAKDWARSTVEVVCQYTGEDEILKLAAKVLETSVEELIRASGIRRYITMDLLYRHGGIENREIGEVFGVDYSTVSQVTH